MTSVVLAATDEAPHQWLDPNIVVDLLWALATPELGIEHLRAATEPGWVRLVVFCVAPDSRSGALAGERLCVVATRLAPQLCGWYVVA